MSSPPEEQLRLHLDPPRDRDQEALVQGRCEHCRKPIPVPAWAQQVELRFCSPQCRRAWAEEAPSLAVSLDGRPGYRGANWEEQARQARQRDGFRCRLCGVSEEELGRQLDVHHQIPYSSFKSNLEANKLENLISVCPACHPKLEAQLRRDLPLFRQPQA